jgi:hypothetical protein
MTTVMILVVLLAFAAIYFSLRDHVFDLAAATDSKRSDAFLIGLTFVRSVIVVGVYFAVRCYFRFHRYR